ncbi:MAG TPA: MBOAT family O-acyltransferase [Candidatus Methylacidiphilales bacterium]|nr:MBOAT family O-acyltransferase [Candidatus Methylacidiphilales bacterium]
MNFADFTFWEHLTEALLVIACLHAFLRWFSGGSGFSIDKLLLASLNIFLLFCVNATSLLIFLSLATFNYLCLHISYRLSGLNRRLFVGLCIPFHLVPLFYYKYSAFALRTVLGVNSEILHNLVIPAGISFYTFQKISLLIDYYRSGDPPPKPLDYLIFSGFFPQTVAGPIERAHNLLPQMQQFRFKWNPKAINEGCSWVIVGLFYKIALADNLSPYIKLDVYQNAWDIWLCNLMFGLKIYFDFGGYSLIALGLARCFGVELSLNFQSPYLCQNMKDFWTRWHVTLNRWFRDYLYFPLGGSRVAWWALNVAFVFFLSGIWHGAGWNFIFWGLSLGVFTVINHLFSKVPTIPAASWALTMICIFFSWLFFYETRLPVLLKKLEILFTPSAYSVSGGSWNFRTSNGLSFTLTEISLVVLCLLVLLLEFLSSRLGDDYYAILRRPEVSIVLIVLGVALGSGYSNGFIYFAF